MGEDKKGSHLHAAKAVFWAFLGVRRQQDYDADAEGLRPVQVIITGLISAAIFVGVLVVLVKYLVSAHG